MTGQNEKSLTIRSLNHLNFVKLVHQKVKSKYKSGKNIYYNLLLLSSCDYRQMFHLVLVYLPFYVCFLKSVCCVSIFMFPRMPLSLSQPLVFPHAIVTFDLFFYYLFIHSFLIHSSNILASLLEHSPA